MGRRNNQSSATGEEETMDENQNPPEGVESAEAPVDPLAAEKNDPVFSERMRNALKNGRVYCESIKTVLARGEAQYPGKRYWHTKAEAEEAEARGDLVILIAK